MDYSFFVLPVSFIDIELRQLLLQYSIDSVTDSRSKNYFGDNVNPGFGSHSIPSTFAEAHPSVQLAVRQAGKIFKSSQFVSVEMNWLQPGSAIKMHTDQSSSTTASGINDTYGTLVSSHHSLHIPLSGEGSYFFRRSMREPSHIQERMVAGQMYLFNNHVMHWVENNGTELRRNMILHFHDPKWESKSEVYRQFKIRGVY